MIQYQDKKQLKDFGIMVFSVSGQTFSKTVLESNQPVLVHFSAPWCGLCRLVNPTLLQLKAQLHEQIKIVEINADENLKLANTYRLTSLPTLILFDRGMIVDRIEGFQGKEALKRKLETMMLGLLAKSA